MNNKHLLILAVAVVLLWMVYRTEGYRTAYRYGFVDTNPARRVSDAFDSPEHRNVYEGLPLP